MINRQGFTLVELLVVIVVITILVAIATVGMTRYLEDGRDSARASSATSIAEALEKYYDQSGEYPSCAAVTAAASTVTSSTLKGLDQSALVVPNATTGTTNSIQCNAVLTTAGTSDFFQYVGDGTADCTGSVSCASFTLRYRNEADNSIVEVQSRRVASSGGGGDGGGGPVTIVDGSSMQTVTNANCPTTRTRAVDSRDNHTYWIQKLADGKCWMLTNLGYQGGGTNTYSDVKTISNGTSDLSPTRTVAKYYTTPSTVNYTTEPNNPSTSTTGAGQYGLLYNYCAATGAQAGTSGCSSATTPLPNPAISVCPAGWRVPTGNGGELGALNAAINGGAQYSDAGLRTNWLAMRGGIWGTAFSQQNIYGYYWSTTQSTSSEAYHMYFYGTYVTHDVSDKNLGYALRCLVN